MFSVISQIFKKSNKDLRKRIYFTLACLGIFCLGTTVTIPWAKGVFDELGFLEIFNLMSGGGLRNLPIFALGVSPYITAEIITQILQMDILPYFKELKEQGYTGRQKINKITRYLGIIFAFVQAYAIIIYYTKSSGAVMSGAAMLKTATVMTAGTAFLLWLGDQITQKGIGNGLSLLIMAGIVQSMPTIFKTAFTYLVTGGTYTTGLGIGLFSGFVVLYLLIIIGIIWITLAERRIPIQYSNRTSSAYGAQQSFLPIKINSAGVMPVIFASILTTVPATVVQLTGKTKAINFVKKYIESTTPTGFLLYILLIFVFGYFYTFLSMNPDEMSKDLNERGGYIPGVRPGQDTSKHIGSVLGKLTFVGSIFLATLSALPIIATKVLKLPNSVTIGGTGILIVVGVAVETYKQIESGLISRSYSERRKRLR